MAAHSDPERHLTGGTGGGQAWKSSCDDAAIATDQLSVRCGLAQPLVSILVPAYNSAHFLREALDSLLAQTYENIEIILLDDASTDETPRVAAEYADRVRCIRQPRNLGIYDNVNAGMALARGEFISIYHADDIYLPTIVQTQVEYLLSHADVGAVFCSDI